MTALLAGAAAGMAVLLVVPERAGRRPRRPDDAATPSLATLRARLDERLPGRRRRRRDRQLPAALDAVASGLRAGQAIQTSIRDVASRTAMPLGGELHTIARDVDDGAALAAALQRWAASTEASPDVRLVAAALILGAGAGGELARAVDGIAATLRERHELRAEVQALATQARASAVVLAVAPVAFMVLVASVEPATAAFLFTDAAGLACLAGGLLLEGLGAAWMARITKGAA